MGRKRLPPNDPHEWLNRAKSNLTRAGNVVPDVYLEDLCFDAQQAAEKAVKAIFVARGETFPYIHDLDRLLRLLQANGLHVPRYVKEAKELTRFASRPRYPSSDLPITPRKHRRAVRIATALMRWAERQI